MLDELLKDQIRNDSEIAHMLAKYNGTPAFFYQKSPHDNDRGWKGPLYPRADYNIDLHYDPERRTAGTMSINVWCTAESAVMPEDIEKRFIQLISGTFYTNKQKETTCAIWSRSDAFDFGVTSNAKNTTPEIFGVTVSFDLLQFPEQITTDPDPIQALNAWTHVHFSEMVIIAHDELPSVFRPTDDRPAVYWRFDSTSTTDRQSYAVTWYTGQFAAHVISDSVKERNRWTKSIIERIQLDGEIILADESPMFAKQIAIRHGADPLREGQLVLTGQYGVLEQRRKETEKPRLNRVNMSDEP